jgi:hypothetical protein
MFLSSDLMLKENCRGLRIFLLFIPYLHPVKIIKIIIWLQVITIIWSLMLFNIADVANANGCVIDGMGLWMLVC